MNSCNFVGMISQQDILSLEQDGGSNVVRFYVDVEEYRKDSAGNRKKMYTMLPFEAWDTAAEYIINNCKVGTMLAIQSNARYDAEHDQTYFRINNFKVFK